MNRNDILMHHANGNRIFLNHNCKTENGITPDEKFKIIQVVGNFEQVIIMNQYKQTVLINPNQIIEPDTTKEDYNNLCKNYGKKITDNYLGNFKGYKEALKDYTAGEIENDIIKEIEILN
jgi:phosphoglycolate phosphatase-like HAD superfamily hydrolase